MDVGGGSIGDDTAHLFDDSKFGDIYTALDIQERERTKRANAREDLAYVHQTVVFKQEQYFLNKSRDKEMHEIRDRLKDIQAKTPNFMHHGLRHPSSRNSHVNQDKNRGFREKPTSMGVGGKPNSNQSMAKQNNTTKPGYNDSKLSPSKRSTMTFMKSHSVDSSIPDRQHLTNNENKHIFDRTVAKFDGSNLKSSQARSVSLPNLKDASQRQKFPLAKCHQQTGHRKLETIEQSAVLKLPDIHDSRLLDDDYQKPLSFQKDTIKPSTRSFIRRASYLSKSLGELYAKRKNFSQPDVPPQSIHKPNFVLFTS